MLNTVAQNLPSIDYIMLVSRDLQADLIWKAKHPLGTRVLGSDPHYDPCHARILYVF